MQVREVVVVNRLGLDAPSCAKIVETASRFCCEVSLTVRGQRASAHSIVAVTLLSASAGDVVRLEVDGPEESRAICEIAALFDNGFQERL